MKVFIKNAITKKILIVLITIVMVSNFIMPNYVSAKNTGEDLVKSFFYLLSYLGDMGISTMQLVMRGDGDITSGDEYNIKYSPGIIFSDEVALLDINFISAKAEDADTVFLGIDNDSQKEFLDILKRVGDENIPKKSEGSISDVVGKSNTFNMDYIGTGIDKFDRTYYILGVSNQNIFIAEKSGNAGFTPAEYKDKGEHKGFTDKVESDTAIMLMWVHNHNLYVFEASDDGYNGIDELVMMKPAAFKYGATTLKEIKDTNNNNIANKAIEFGSNASNGAGFTSRNEERIVAIRSGYLYSYDLTKLEGQAVTKDNIAFELKDNIATWYMALRTIALVGLLSALVYIGIRIILSSTSAQNKAKYKGMLKDWLVAICILFMLHYIMAFMLQITDNLNDIIKNNIQQVDTEGNIRDQLMSTVREQIGDFDNITDLSRLDVAGYTVMYLALVILTITFTIQYLKRVIFMAFLTMVAPMIALTYPLDKVKDGKAQAFSYWLREYIFNCLIQPVHLLIYTILITNALDFATNNVLYAIVALAFMVPAEKFVKSMFGMKSESPVSTIGAAAGGAMVMSMLNKIKSKPPKEDAGSGSSGKSNNIRTANNGGAAGGNQAGGNQAGGNQAGGNQAGGNQNGGNQNTGRRNRRTRNQNNGNQNSGQSSSSMPVSIGRGLNALGKKHIYGVDAIKSNTKKLIRATGGAALGAAAGTVALAANVADGEILDNPSKAATEIGVATAAGYHAGNNLTGRGMQFASEEWKTFKEGAYGYDKFYDIGVTDKDVINSAIENGISADKYKEYADLGLSSVNDMVALETKGMSADNYKEYSGLGITSVNDILALNGNHIDANKLKDIQTKTGETDPKKIMRYNTLAEAAIAAGISSGNRGAFITWARGNGMDVDDAKKLYNKVRYFM